MFIYFFLVSATVLFSYGEKYPEETPTIEFEDSTNIEDFDLTELLDYLNDQVSLSEKEKV